MPDGDTAAMDQGLQYRESWHRLKNALQTVEILTRREMRAAQGDEARRRLKYLDDNILMLMRLNDALNRGVDLQSAFRDVTEYWRSACADYGIEVRFLCGSRAALPERNATSLALLTHEAVTNCIEHAFPDGRTGLIVISMRADGDGHSALEVADDGVGIRQTGGTLGQSLMHALAASMDGALSVQERDRGGTSVVVRFPSRGQEVT
ncbi:sensor histidine kinase [Psychromarinibacter sp. C21-152]|uniref:histidine kinase n=1 Tax=Psychromarinibacter sediminicola TaxID=3033385 RepID=A0AAE3NP02_9RHOB|nr:sensor histidine kinase [Psychromarinibacter sediminicola]MDF0599456.1 sensor histidine kinase [Psychromarinibacter sediminicola]